MEVQADQKDKMLDNWSVDKSKGLDVWQWKFKHIKVELRLGKSES